MTDQKKKNATPKQAVNQSVNNEQQFSTQRIYLRDLSFESPMGAKAFTSKIRPTIDQELSTETVKVSEDLYEVQLKITVSAKIEEETAFLVEVHQAGLFLIKGVVGTDLNRVINTTCPQMLFPYAREVIDSSLTKASFPPLMLPPVNFKALYAQAMAEKKDAAH